jgi:hypothetical protein
VLTGVGGVTLGIDNGTGVVFLIVREFRCEMFGDIGGDEHSEFIGVMVAAEDGCQYCGKGVLLMEKVCDEGSSVRVDGSDEELLKSLDAQSSSPLGKGGGDVHLRESAPQCTAMFR